MPEGLSAHARRAILRAVKEQFLLGWHGVHGPSHWARVRQNGLRLARATGARIIVVELFAFLHDACRENEFRDPDHGWRAARLAEQMNASLFELPDNDLALLVEACEGHSGGETDADATVATCWDADRLDLGRVGMRPDPRRLCTDAARDPEVIAWAYERSVAPGAFDTPT